MSLSPLPPKIENFDLIGRENNQELMKVDADLWKTRINDYKGRLRARWVFVVIIIALLLCQNVGFGWFVYLCLREGKLVELQNFLGVITAATLLETYALIKIMIESVFKEIDYEAKVISK